MPFATRDDDDRLTVRIPRPAVALLLALVAHFVTAYVANKLPTPKPVEHPIEITLTKPPPRAQSPAKPAAPPPSAPKVAERTPKPPKPHRETPRSPVVPELPPVENPPPEQPELPIAEKDPDAMKPPEPAPPQTWKERLQAQLEATRPKATRIPDGPLMPDMNTVAAVANADPRMHDEEMEHRIAEDFGPFFRRGLEQLRSNWHPDDVLNQTERDPATRCGREDRTTFAVAVLDREGHVVDVDLKRESGCPQLDAEAVRAFKRVAQFPHPPAGIFVGPDGTPHDTARYPVRFIVTFDGGIRLNWG